MILVLLIPLFPSALRPQMPPRPARLIISSEPSGASVYINKRKMSQLTNLTFVVSPGRYTIEVVGGNFSCAGAPSGSSAAQNQKAARTVAVSAGQTISLDCTPSGWRN